MTERDIAARLIGVLDEIADASYVHGLDGLANFYRLQASAEIAANAARELL